MGNTPFYEDLTGPRWPLHLTERYNDSFIQTYCFARSGASVDKTIDNNVNPPDFVEQVDDIFIPAYVEYDFNESNWESETSLFIIFFGINDNRLLDQREKRKSWVIQETILERYAEMLHEVRLNIHNSCSIALNPKALCEWRSQLFDYERATYWSFAVRYA